MQWHERGGIKLYCLERMQLKERGKKSEDYMIKCYGPSLRLS